MLASDQSEKFAAQAGEVRSIEIICTVLGAPPAVFAAPLGFASISVYLLGDDSVGGVTQESLTD